MQTSMKMIFTESFYTLLHSVSSFYCIKYGVENLRLASAKTYEFITIFLNHVFCIFVYPSFPDFERLLTQLL